MKTGKKQPAVPINVKKAEFWHSPYAFAVGFAEKMELWHVLGQNHNGKLPEPHFFSKSQCGTSLIVPKPRFFLRERWRSCANAGEAARMRPEPHECKRNHANADESALTLQKKPPHLSGGFQHLI